jgi:hypothetical protein
MTMKNAVFWDITPRGVYKNRRFGALYRLHNHCGTFRLLVIADVVPRSQILFIRMMKAICTKEISVITRATRRNIPEDDILRSHRRETTR